MIDAFTQRLAELVKQGVALQTAITQAAGLLGREATLRDVQNARLLYPNHFPLHYRTVR